MPAIGNNRSEAVWQLLGLVYLLTIYPFVLAIGLIGGLVYMVLDVIMKLVTDRPGGNNSLSSYGIRLFEWPISQLQWVATGKGSFQYLP